MTAANDRIRQLVAEDPARVGMGTTTTALLWDGTRMAAGHIGDSRAYVLHDGGLRQVTRDHTFVQSLVDEGQITPLDAREHPARSVVMKVLQGEPSIEPDFWFVDVKAGDRLLVCSDGLSDVVSDPVIELAMRTAKTLDDVADELIELALSGGGPDNVTVVLAELVASDALTSSDDQAKSVVVGASAGSGAGSPAL
jgi:protein phosphatase